MVKSLLDRIWPATGKGSQVGQGYSGRLQNWAKGFVLFLILFGLVALAIRSFQTDPVSTRLTYAVLPASSPLRVSEDHAAFTVLMTNGTDQPVELKSVTFHLPGGEKSGDLTTDIGAIHSDTPGIDWSVIKVGGGLFRLEPNKAKKVQLGPGDGLCFTFSEILVNKKPGLVDLEITEEINAAMPWSSAKRSTTLQLAKLPSRFNVSDLSADPLIVDVGGASTLWWSGNEQALYTIRYVDRNGTIKEEEVQGWSYTTPPLQKTTTFYLIAEAREGENAVTVQRELTITVK